MPPRNLAGAGTGPPGPVKAAKRRSASSTTARWSTAPAAGTPLPGARDWGRRWGRSPHAGRAVVGREIGPQPPAIERAHRRAGAEDRAADRLIGKRGRLQEL